MVFNVPVVIRDLPNIVARLLTVIREIPKIALVVTVAALNTTFHRLVLKF